MEAHILPWDRNIKKGNCDFLSQNSDFLFKFHKFKFHNSVVFGFFPRHRIINIKKVIVTFYLIVDIFPIIAKMSSSEVCIVRYKRRIA